MSRVDRYRINSPSVIHETIDGEVVIVNLDKGHYYSLRDSGTAIWNCVIQGMSKPEIVSTILVEYEGDRDHIENGVGQILAQLQSEEMIVKDGNGEDLENSLEVETPPSRETIKQQFKSPVLERYTDMEDLLLLDPIHEVDESGWPHAAPPDSKKVE